MWRPATNRLVVATAWLALISSAEVFGENSELLHMKDGKQMAGVSRGFEAGSLRWEMPHGTIIAVPLSEIDRIEYQAPISVPDAPADSQILSVRPDVSADPDLAPPADDGEFRYFDTVGKANRRLWDRSRQRLEDWTKRIEFGGRFLHGNSDEDFLNVLGKFEREDEIRFYQVDLGGQYGNANGDTTTNRWYANGTIDFCREGNWIVFVASKNEFDEFENLNYRGTLSGGLGYRFYNEEIRRLIFRVGPGVTYEQFHSPEMTRTTPDLFGEVELRWPIFLRTDFVHKTTVNPSAEDLDVFRLVSNYGLIVRLDTKDTWSLKIGLRHEYNSRPNDDRERSDFTTSILLVYQLR